MVKIWGLLPCWWEGLTSWATMGHVI